MFETMKGYHIVRIVFLRYDSPLLIGAKNFILKILEQSDIRRMGIPPRIFYVVILILNRLLKISRVRWSSAMGC